MLNRYDPRRLTSSRVKPGGTRKGSARFFAGPAWRSRFDAPKKKAARQTAAALTCQTLSLIGRRRGRQLFAGPFGQAFETIGQRKQLSPAAQIEP